MTFEPIHLSHALALAVENARSGKGGPFGAVLVKDGRVIGQGTNLVTSANDPTAHAEINAIREACRRLNTFRLDDSILYASCEPCPMCLGAIYWARIGRVFYAATRSDAAHAGFDDALFYNEFTCAPDKRILPMEHIPLEESLAPFSEWNLSRKRVDY